MDLAEPGAEGERGGECPVTAKLTGHIRAGGQGPGNVSWLACVHARCSSVSASEHEQQAGRLLVDPVQPWRLPAAVRHPPAAASAGCGAGVTGGNPPWLKQAPGAAPVAHAEVVAG